MTSRADFRSDTVTKPSRAMRAAMASAEVGDAVYDDCPTTKRLEAMAAELLGKESALFFPTGTQSNLAGLMAHCGRGDEYIVGQHAHTYRNEGGGAAVLGSIQPQPLPNEADGTIALDAIVGAIKPADFHHPVSRLLTLEDTFSGSVLPDGYLQEATDVARAHGLATHLDGARMMNAAIASGRDPAWIAGWFDTVSLCLSKGLGAPVGSLLAGPRETIEKARRIRKMLGGGMRQTGVLAAAGIYALEHNVARLGDDHRRADRLARALSAFPPLGAGEARTNMVFMTPHEDVDVSAFRRHLADRGIILGDGYGTMRWVTHLDIDDAAIDLVDQACAEFFAPASGPVRRWAGAQRALKEV
ncbi:L-threonine aldolase [Tessaracoccus oleiagri]|uniref:L-threonine aldolase n=1 Tax=Tessaracoccus oleiagri TaxID=686624 RepID=A0A1G9ML61_9ACTN|nr:L-threonine aldolase [Tessaracoccus oleiagri]